MPCPLLPACPLPTNSALKFLQTSPIQDTTPNQLCHALTTSMTADYQACSNASLSSSTAYNLQEEVTYSLIRKRRRARQRSLKQRKARGGPFKRRTKQGCRGWLVVVEKGRYVREERPRKKHKKRMHFRASHVWSPTIISSSDCPHRHHQLPQFVHLADKFAPPRIVAATSHVANDSTWASQAWFDCGQLSVCVQC